MATKVDLRRHQSVVVDKNVRIRCLSSFAGLELTHEDGTPVVIPPEAWSRPARDRKKRGRSFEA